MVSLIYIGHVTIIPRLKKNSIKEFVKWVEVFKNDWGKFVFNLSTQISD